MNQVMVSGGVLCAGCLVSLLFPLVRPVVCFFLPRVLIVPHALFLLDQTLVVRSPFMLPQWRPTYSLLAIMHSRSWQQGRYNMSLYNQMRPLQYSRHLCRVPSSFFHEWPLTQRTHYLRYCTNHFYSGLLPPRLCCFLWFTRRPVIQCIFHSLVSIQTPGLPLMVESPF